MMACETTPNVPMTAPDADPGNPIGAWRLQSFEPNEGSAIPVPDPSQYTLELRDDGRAHVRADCNICNGPYEVVGATLSFGVMGCTLAACPEGSLEVDYLQALGSASIFQRSGDTLALAYGGGVMQFRAQ